MTDFRGFASQIVNQFSTRHPVVEELLRWKKQSDHYNPSDVTFHEKAVKALVRKLKRGKEKGGSQTEKLVRTIQNQNGDLGCIVIPRSLDGRMQVCNKKVLPHVLYCSIWRWPEIKNQHELRHIPGCEYSPSLKKDQICVNPYHYERLRSQPIAPVLVPKLPPNQVPESLWNSMVNGFMPIHDEEKDWVVATNMTLGEQAFSTRPLNSPNGFGDGQLSECSETLSPPTSPMSDITMNSMGSSVGTATSVIMENTNYIQKSFQKFSLDPPKYDSGQGSSPLSSSPSSQSDMATIQEVCDDVQIKVEPEDPDVPSTSSSVPSVPQPQLDIPMRTEVEFKETESWCTLSYYEMNQRCGKAFEGKVPIIKIDGFTTGPIEEGDDNRFALGSIPNQNRLPEVEQVRRTIGTGVELVYECGKVSIKNMSRGQSVFIQSAQMNDMFRMDHKTVCKIPAGHEVDIFDNQKFAARLGKLVEFGFEAVYRLYEMCTIRLSFVKGWGSEYRRAHVTSTPCWTEIRLNGPLQWLDRVLREMGGPNKPMTSFS